MAHSVEGFLTRSRIVESNPKKFNLDAPELAKRKAFISATRKEVQVGPASGGRGQGSGGRTGLRGQRSGGMTGLRGQEVEQGSEVRR